MAREDALHVAEAQDLTDARSVAERALRRVDEYRDRLAPSRPAKKEDPVPPAPPAARMAAAAGLGSEGDTRRDAG